MSASIRILALALGALLLAGPTAAGDGSNLEDGHPFLTLLSQLTVTRGREHRALLVYPIAADSDDPAGLRRPLTAKEAVADEGLTVAEPEKGAGRGPVELLSWSLEPILLLGGEVLVGGHRDRYLARDVLLGSRRRVEAPAYLGDRKARPKDERRRELEPLGALAPHLLRFVGLVDGPASAADSFLTDHYAIAGIGSKRETLAGLLSADMLAGRAREYREIFAAVPDEAKRRVVGVAALVGDRLVGIDLFDSNLVFRAHWPTLLRTLSFQAALYEAAYGILSGASPSAGRDPDRRKPWIRKRLKSLLAVRTAKATAVDLGEELRVAVEDLRGRVLTHEGRVVHAAIMLDYLRLGVDTPPTTSSTDLSMPELERRAEDGTLTEFERRWLERLRETDGRFAPRPTQPARPGSRPQLPGGDEDR